LAKMAKDPIDGIAGKKQAILGPMVFADLVQQVGRMARPSTSTPDCRSWQGNWTRRWALRS
jgi:hypothetical protein